MDQIKILFIGTSELAVTLLQRLIGQDFVEICGVVTQPDKPTGRKQELTPPPVKAWLNAQGEKYSFPVYQPVKLRLEATEILARTQPDLIVVAAYGQMIPDDMLNSPKYKCLNVHGSLLPKLRGAVPVQMAILQGFQTTGVTIQRMVKELDAGPIITQSEIDILPQDTSADLMQRVAQVGSDLLIEVLPAWVKGEIPEQLQDENEATFCYQDDLAKPRAEITFDTDIDQAERMVRAFYPWPVAWITLPHGQRAKIFKVAISSRNSSNLDKLEVSKEGKKLFLHLRSGVLELSELQVEGKQRRPASEYLYLAS